MSCVTLYGWQFWPFWLIFMIISTLQTRDCKAKINLSDLFLEMKKIAR